MPRGRPLKSEVRDRIGTILHYLETAYGYQVARIYNEIYPQVTQRLIYYHLRKGAQIEEFIILETKQEKGDFSWGTTVEKTYYTLGSNTKPKTDKRVENLIQKWKKQANQNKENLASSPSVFTRFADKFRKEK